VDVLPTSVWPDTSSDIASEDVGREWDTAESFHTGETHQTVVTSSTNTRGAQPSLELCAPSVKDDDGADGVEEGEKAEDEWWEMDQKDGGRGVDGDWVAADIFEDVEAVALHDVLKGNGNETDAQRDEEIDDHVLASLSWCDDNLALLSDEEKSSIDA
jgi:hypothetical protein